MLMIAGVGDAGQNSNLLNQHGAREAAATGVQDKTKRASSQIAVHIDNPVPDVSKQANRRVGCGCRICQASSKV